MKKKSNTQARKRLTKKFLCRGPRRMTLKTNKMVLPRVINISINKERQDAKYSEIKINIPNIIVRNVKFMKLITS